MISPPEKTMLGFVPGRYFMSGPHGGGFPERHPYLRDGLQADSGWFGTEYRHRRGGGSRGRPCASKTLCYAMKRMSRPRLFCWWVRSAAAWRRNRPRPIKRGLVTKPVIAFLAGHSAPAGTKLGHAGAIVSKGRGDIKSKIESMKKAGVLVAKLPSEAIEMAKKVVG